MSSMNKHPRFVGNPRVPDGHLFRAVAAELYQVAVESDIDVINTYYIDPHAALANRVADALVRMPGGRQ
jgi:hypothetical protein